MNKKNLFEKSAETTAHGSIRTSKRFKGAVATVALAGAVAVVGGNNVSADEVTSPNVVPTTEVVAQPTTTEVSQPVAETAVSEVSVAPVAETQPVVSTPQETPVVASTDVPKVTNATVDVTTTTNGNTTTVDTTERQAAVAEAEKAGLNIEVNERPVNLGTASTVVEETELQNQAKAAIDKEAAAVEAKTQNFNDYRGELTTYREELQKAKDGAEAGHFSDKQISDFLDGASDTSGIRVLNPLSNTGKVVFDKGTLEEIFKDEIPALKQELKFADDPNPIIDKILEVDPNAHLYKIRVGDTFSYTGLFSDDITVKYEITEIPKNELGLNYGVTALSDKSPSFNKFQLGQYGFKLSFLNSDGTAAVGNYILGFGDVDNNQTLTFLSTPSQTLNGEKVTKVSNNVFTAPSVAIESSTDPQGQVWAMFKDVSTVEYKYSESDINVPHGFREISFWHEVGGIDFQIDLPTPPKAINPTTTINNYTYNTIGSVTTVHVAEGGTVLIPKATKVDGEATGTSYDVSAHENKIVTSDGKTYNFVSVTPNAKGNVELGTTDVIFTYKEALGTVTVITTDKNGNKIRENIVDTPATSTGTAYDTTDHKPKIIKDGDKTYVLVPNLTKGNETGKVVEGNTNVTYVYERVGDVTTVHVSTNGDVLIPKATKVDGKEVGSNYDVSKHDDKIITEDGRTFKFVSVTPNATGQVKDGVINVVFTYEEVFGNVIVEYNDPDGNVIKEPVEDTPLTSTGKSYDTTDNKPRIIENNGDKYILIPNLTKGNETGKVTEGNTKVVYVYNKLEAMKGITNEKGENIDGGKLGLGQKGTYGLKSPSVIASVFEQDGASWVFEDDLDERGDKYLGAHVNLVKEIKLEDGTVLKSGEDLLNYGKGLYENGKYTFSLNSDFLKAIADDQELEVFVSIDIERIASGTFENTGTFYINGEPVNTNTVKSTTDEPVTPQPKTPENTTPTTPLKETPVAPAAMGAALPNTGEASGAFLSMLGIASVISVAFISRKKKA